MPAKHSHRGNLRQGESKNVDRNTRLALYPLVQPRRSCLALLSSRFLAVRDARVKGYCVSPGCRLVSRTKIEISRQECKELHSSSLVSGNSRPRPSPNALGDLYAGIRIIKGIKFSSKNR